MKTISLLTSLMPDAVSDSSPLIHLAKIEALELISRLYSRILVPRRYGGKWSRRVKDVLVLWNCKKL